MPEYTVRWILGRALSNPAYRELMAQDPRAAWAGYELTEDDLAELKKWTPERIREFLAEMERKVASASFDGMTGFDFDAPSAPVNCDDALDGLIKLLGEDST